jgi:hypothetical protein
MDQDRRGDSERPTLARKRGWGVYVERTTRQWVVMDPDGQLWILPAVDDPWPNRQPFELTEGTDLDPVPGHYRYTLGLPL